MHIGIVRKPDPDRPFCFHVERGPGRLHTVGSVFVKLVAVLSINAFAGVLVGAGIVAPSWHCDPLWPGSIGGVAGLVFGLAQTGQIRGQLLDPHFPPGDRQQRT